MRVQTRELQKELEFISRFVEKTTTIPMLANVSMTANAGKLLLVATDLELSGITSVDGESDGEGKPDELWATTVPIKTLGRYLAKIEDDTLDIACITTESEPMTRMVPVWDADGALQYNEDKTPKQVEETFTNKTYHLQLDHGGEGHLLLEVMSTESFPEIPVPKKMLAELRGLKEATPKVICAVSQEESRFTLNGVLLTADGVAPNQFVATDGHRMSLVPMDLTALEPFTALIHKKALWEAARMNGGSCLFGAEGEHQIFMSERRSIIARKLSGNFPDWERVVPKNFAHAITLDRNALAKTIERASVMADERSKAIYVSIGGGKFTVEASTYDSGSAKGSIPAGGTDGVAEGYRAGLNYSYVMDFLAKATGEIEFRTPEYNEKLGCVQGTMCFVDATGWTMLVMPLRF